MTSIFSCTSEVAQGKTIIDGVITELGARLGSEVRIVQPRRVRVDGSWFDVPEHQTLVQKIWNKALEISTLGLCPLVLYSGKEGVWKVESH